MYEDGTSPELARLHPVVKRNPVSRPPVSSGEQLPESSSPPILDEMLTAAHNIIHGVVGGIMASYQSSFHPVFWLHHCNVDRVYEATSATPQTHAHHASPRAAPPPPTPVGAPQFRPLSAPWASQP